MPLPSGTSKPPGGSRHPDRSQELVKLIVETDEQMGEVIACTARLVAAWEDGEVLLPRAVYRRILTRLTGRTMQDLGCRLPARPGVRAASPARLIPLVITA